MYPSETFRKKKIQEENPEKIQGGIFEDIPEEIFEYYLKMFCCFFFRYVPATQINTVQGQHVGPSNEESAVIHPSPKIGNVNPEKQRIISLLAPILPHQFARYRDWSSGFRLLGKRYLPR